MHSHLGQGNGQRGNGVQGQGNGQGHHRGWGQRYSNCGGILRDGLTNGQLKCTKKKACSAISWRCWCSTGQFVMVDLPRSTGMELQRTASQAQQRGQFLVADMPGSALMSSYKEGNNSSERSL